MNELLFWIGCITFLIGLILYIITSLPLYAFLVGIGFGTLYRQAQEYKGK